MITGHFREFYIFMAFILVHELGHIIPALYFRWNIEKIVILPFGGITIFQEKINKPLLEEFLIAIGGICMQILFYHATKWVQQDLPTKIHYGLLFFNLLPIFPLDGSKISNILFNIFFPFIKSHTLSIIVSYIGFLFLLFYSKGNLILYFSLFFLLLRMIKEVKNHVYLLEQFLWERYLYSFPFKKEKEIHFIKEMKRDYLHVFIKENKRIQEKDFLRNWFDKKV